MNFVVAIKAAVALVPLVGWVPDQPPEAVQVLVLVDAHFRVDELPLFTVVGVAAMVTEGGGTVTDTVVDCDVLPPLPVQVRP